MTMPHDSSAIPIITPILLANKQLETSAKVIKFNVSGNRKGKG